MLFYLSYPSWMKVLLLKWPLYMYFRYQCIHWYKFEVVEVERSILSCTCTVVYYILEYTCIYMYIGQIAKKKKKQNKKKKKTKKKQKKKRGPKGHITCTWLQRETFMMDWPGRPFLYTNRPGKHKPENTNLVEEVEILLPVLFRWIPFSGFREKVENVSDNQRPGRPSCFPIGPKNTNLVEDVEILLPVKFHWILYSGFRREVENVSANQRQGRPSCFSDRP